MKEKLHLNLNERFQAGTAGALLGLGGASALGFGFVNHEGWPIFLLTGMMFAVDGCLKFKRRMAELKDQLEAIDTHPKT